jgi:hypothetical protein
MLDQPAGNLGSGLLQTWRRRFDGVCARSDDTSPATIAKDTRKISRNPIASHNLACILAIIAIRRSNCTIEVHFAYRCTASPGAMLTEAGFN